MRRPLPFAILVLLGVALDQLTKALAFWLLPPEGMYPFLPGVFHFTHAKNEGVAFSMLAGWPLVVLGISLLAVPLLIWWYARIWRTAHAAMVAALGLVISGAAGNLIDRLAFNYVRDFLDFVPPLPLIGKWAVFNVADIFICCGVALMLYAEFFGRKEESPAPAQAAAPKESAHKKADA